MAKALSLDDMMVRNLKPKSARYEVVDGEGLVLRVTPAGGKSWHFRYTFDGEQKRMSLGKYPGLSLSEARKRKDDLLSDIANRIDPAEKAEEEKRKHKEEPTFIDLLEEFWTKELQHKPTAQDQKRLVTKDVLPVWKSRKVGSITRRDAVLLLDKVRERAPVTGNRVQTVLIRMFNFAAEQGIIENSSLAGLKRKSEESRKRVLGDEEIRKLWTALDLESDIDIYAGTKLALKMILLTGQRPGEVSGMMWSDIKGSTWMIPATRRKTDEDQHVPLTGMMIDILNQARVFGSDSQYVFTSQRSPLYRHRKPNTAKPKEEDSHVTRLSLSHAINRHWEGMGFSGAERFTPHDLRRTLRTRLAELKVEDVIAERVLGHKLQGVLAIYNRYDYAAEKRQALEQWESRLREILSIAEQKTNVIPLEAHNV